MISILSVSYFNTPVEHACGGVVYDDSCKLIKYYTFRELCSLALYKSISDKDTSYLYYKYKVLHDCVEPSFNKFIYASNNRVFTLSGGLNCDDFYVTRVKSYMNWGSDFELSRPLLWTKNEDPYFYLLGVSNITKDYIVDRAYSGICLISVASGFKLFNYFKYMLIPFEYYMFLMNADIDMRREALPNILLG